MKALRDHPIRAFAVLFVAVISAFVMWMRYRQLEVLFSPDWCNRAMKAEQLDLSSRLDAALACVGLQSIQIKSIATNSYIDGGTIALCLLTLIVIVIAKGQVRGKAGTSGVEFDISDGDTPPTPVVVTNPPSNPIPTTEAPPIDPSTLDPTTGMPR